MMNNQVFGHVSVMAGEVLSYLRSLPDRVVVDCTAGLGGHTQALLDADSDIKVIGLDLDDNNLSIASERLKPYGNRVNLVRANFAELRDILNKLGVDKVGGILADLGISSNQLADGSRGFGIDADGPLDMRLDQRSSTTAADIINNLSEKELADLLYLQSQERRSRRIAWRICQERLRGRLDSTVALARVVAAALGEDPRSRRSRIDPATRTFLALRIAVNDEIGSLRRLLEQIPLCLHAGGRAAIITFHSGEDRVVKEDFRERTRMGRYRLLTKKPIAPTEAEIRDNPRSRSAKLRVAEML